VDDCAIVKPGLAVGLGNPTICQANAIILKECSCGTAVLAQIHVHIDTCAAQVRFTDKSSIKEKKTAP